jgi:hypothetical protein
MPGLRRTAAFGTQTTARERFMVGAGSVAAMIQRLTHVCSRK